MVTTWLHVYCCSIGALVMRIVSWRIHLDCLNWRRWNSDGAYLERVRNEAWNRCGVSWFHAREFFCEPDRGVQAARIGLVVADTSDGTSGCAAELARAAGGTRIPVAELAPELLVALADGAR